MEEIYCFAGNPLDRASERRRDTAWIGTLLDDPAARILPLGDLRPLTRGSASPVLDWQKVAPWRDRIEHGATLIFLGLDDERPYFAVDASGADIPLAPESEPLDARTLAPLLPTGEAAILAEARSLIDWHARHRFCAQCGSPTRVVAAGRVRYLACQPWPFPSSLMMGFLCEGLTAEITVDPEELAEARWFEREEIRAMVARAATGPDDLTQVSVPGPVAIAHQICRRWSYGLDSL